MPDSGMVFLSLLSVVVGGCLVLSPQTLLTLSERLNVSLVTLDRWLIRHRYIMGIAAFGASYAFFSLALQLPSLGR